MQRDFTWAGFVHKENIIELLREEESPEGWLVRFFLWNDREYSVTNTPVFPGDAQLLLKAILQQSINDYIKLSSKLALKEEEQFDLQTAIDFLFDDSYEIDFGNLEMTVKDILFYLIGSEPNMQIFRTQIREQLNDFKKKK